MKEVYLGRSGWFVTDAYVGNPPPNVVQWVREHRDKPDPERTSEWDNLVLALEGCSQSDFDQDSLEYLGDNEIIRSTLVDKNPLVNYNIYQDKDPVKTTWIPLGFNASIPEYVKYRKKTGSGWNHIWVKSTKDGLLSPITVGDQVYTRTYDETTLDNTYVELSNQTVTVTDGSFTYGNNYGTSSTGNEYDARWTVPSRIRTNRGSYDFCGYNVTLNSQAILNIEGYKTLIWTGDPLSSSGSNDWSSSLLRRWLNSTSGIDDMYFSNSGVGGTKHSDYLGLVSRLSSEEGFLKNISKCVNKTWVHSSFISGKTLDSSQCEHVIDKFWILGNGHANCMDTKFSSSGPDLLQDQTCDSFYYPQYTRIKIYNHSSNDTRIKRDMNTDGSTSSTAGRWWLRSAYSAYSYRSGYVDNVGTVGSDAVYVTNWSGVSPVCVVG